MNGMRTQAIRSNLWILVEAVALILLASLRFASTIAIRESWADSRPRFGRFPGAIASMWRATFG